MWRSSYRYNWNIWLMVFLRAGFVLVPLSSHWVHIDVHHRERRMRYVKTWWLFPCVPWYSSRAYDDIDVDAVGKYVVYHPWCNGCSVCDPDCGKCLLSSFSECFFSGLSKSARVLDKVR